MEVPLCSHSRLRRRGLTLLVDSKHLEKGGDCASEADVDALLRGDQLRRERCVHGLDSA